MRLTLALASPPKFHFWKEFGAGRRHRLPYYKYFWHIWRRHLLPMKADDHTLSAEHLPPGARVMEAEDFLKGPIDFMPDQLLELKHRPPILFDHPWPYNVQLDPKAKQEPIRTYTIDSRFYVPRDDCLVLTNTLLETDQMEANPPVEPSEELVAMAKRQHEWAAQKDSILTRLPKKREFPFINRTPKTRFGITKERTEFNTLTSFYDLTRTLLAQNYHQQKDQSRVEDLLHMSRLNYPQCQAPYLRGQIKFQLDLVIEAMSLARTPLPLLDPEPAKTAERDAPSIRPRTWKTLLEPTRRYTPDWSFTLPQNVNLHTIHLASRIKRDHRNADEMLARCLVHAFGVTSQFARLRAHEDNLRRAAPDDGQNVAGRMASVVLQDPLNVGRVNDKDLLDRPVVVQAIGYDLPMESFHFLRFQLNSLIFDDDNERRIKNQAWYSGPVTDLTEVLRFHLDFLAFDSASSMRIRSVQQEQNTEGITS